MDLVGPRRGVVAAGGVAFRVVLPGTRTRASNRYAAPTPSKRSKTWLHGRKAGAGYRGTSGRPGCADRQAKRGEGDGEPPRRERQCKTGALPGKRTQEAAAVSRRGKKPAPSRSLHRRRGRRGGNRPVRRRGAAPARTRPLSQGPASRTLRTTPW